MERKMFQSRSTLKRIGRAVRQHLYGTLWKNNIYIYILLVYSEAVCYVGVAVLSVLLRSVHVKGGIT